MTLADRCDEIVRLIDETLVAVVADVRPEADTHPAPADLVTGGRRRSEPTVPRRRRRHGADIRL